LEGQLEFVREEAKVIELFIYLAINPVLEEKSLLYPQKEQRRLYSDNQNYQLKS
jgi:hypothetical protein